MNNPILVCKNLSRTFSQGKLKVEVLKDVNLSVAHSEMLAIIGSSGSGKSTLLHALGGLDTPNCGEIYIDGQDILKMSENKISSFRNKNIGFVYQFHHLLPEFSALENIAMPLLIGGTDKDSAHQQASKMLDKVSMLKRQDHRPAELSGGERQRVAIARALVTQPKVILADEPTGNLDHKTASSVFDIMRELNQEIGTAMIVVTHDIKLANSLDRAIELKSKTLMI